MKELPAIDVTVIDLPIVHIEQLAEQLGLERRWILENWLTGDDPAPHERQGHQIIFNKRALDEWSYRRCLATGGTPYASTAPCV